MWNPFHKSLAPVEKRNNPMENPSVSLGNIGAIWSWISGTEPTASGEIIDEHVALQIVTVYRCIRIISESIATLPLRLYRRQPRGRKEAIDHSLHNLLTVAPNPEMGAVTFWETMVGCLALCGNSYSYIQRAGNEVVALWPLSPKKTHPVRLPNGQLAFQTTDGLGNGEHKTYAASDILHFKLFSWDGLLGLSPIMQARQGLGLARAAEKLGCRLFQNNGRPAGVMTTDMNLDDIVLKNVRESWQSSQTGDNALKCAFLPGNWRYTPVSLDMEQVQMLDTRKFSRTEIAALFGVPSHMVGDTTRQSNTNSSNEALQLVTFCLRPYLSRIENEIARVLLPTVGTQADQFFVEFDVRELLRADFESTQKGLAIGRQWGWFNANYCLEVLNENPIDGPVGEMYIVPVNFQNALTLADPQAPPADPSADAGPGADPVADVTQGDSQSDNPATTDDSAFDNSGNDQQIPGTPEGK